MTGASIHTNIVLGGRILAFLGGHVGVEVKLVKFEEIKMMKLEETTTTTTTTTKALFTRLIIRLFQLVFSVGTTFFSHNKSANSVFQPAYQHSRTGPKPFSSKQVGVY
jgi:hypothetical protein